MQTVHGFFFLVKNHFIVFSKEETMHTRLNWIAETSYSVYAYLIRNV